MKKHRLRGLRRMTLMILVATGVATATTVVRMELAELVRRADAIVQGRVETVYSRWDAEKRVAFTYVAVRVDEPLKGERRRSLLIRQLGGKVGALNVFVAGMPQFRQGEEVIVFLRRQGDGTFQVVGMNQGRYEIVEDFAVANVSGVELFDPKTGQISKAAFVERAPLEEFKARIRELVR